MQNVSGAPSNDYQTDRDMYEERCFKMFHEALF